MPNDTGRLDNPVTRAKRAREKGAPEYPTSYKGCAAIWQTRRRKLANNTYLVAATVWAEAEPCPWYGIRLHETVVIQYFRDGSIRLDSGGWQTVTTKARINCGLPSGWIIGSDRGVWYLYRPGENGYSDFKNGIPFADGIVIGPRGGISGSGPDAKKTRKLRERINRFCRDYVAALWAGKVPAPGAGDCFYCQMPERCYIGTVKDGKLETRQGVHPDHLLSHMREKYYVPSLLNLAAKANPDTISRAAGHQIGHLWGYHDAGPFPGGDFLQEQIRKCLRKYMLHAFGLSV